MRTFWVIILFVTGGHAILFHTVQKLLLNGVLFHVLAMPNTDRQQQINQSQSATLDDMLVQMPVDIVA